MAHYVKRVISVLIASALLLSITSISAFAEQGFDVIKAKQSLAEEHKGKYVQLSPAQAKTRSKEIDQALLNLYAENTSLETIEEIMQGYKVYKLEVPADYEVAPASIPTDALCNPVDIYYDAAVQEWVVVGGGWWSNTNWFDDTDPVEYHVGNMGGFDSVGIEFNGTYGSYNGVSVISSYGYMTDHHGTSITSEYPSHGDGQYGAAFDFQEYTHYTSDGCFGFFWVV